MNVYGIRNNIDGTWWSRNKWATRTSIPDLFKSPYTASYQLNEGKVADYVRRHPNQYKPELVLFSLNLKHVV
jgi:hypothetical protein